MSHEPECASHADTMPCICPTVLRAYQRGREDAADSALRWWWGQSKAVQEKINHLSLWSAARGSEDTLGQSQETLWDSEQSGNTGQLDGEQA